MPSSLSTASGFGPRTTDLTSLTAARNRSRSTCRSICATQMPRADAGEKDHDVDPAGDEPIGEIDGRLIALERHFAHRRADERHAAPLGDHPRHVVGAATFERGDAEAGEGGGVGAHEIYSSLSACALRDESLRIAARIHGYGRFMLRRVADAQRKSLYTPRAVAHRARNKCFNERKSRFPRNMFLKKSCLTQRRRLGQWRAVG